MESGTEGALGLSLLHVLQEKGLELSRQQEDHVEFSCTAAEKAAESACVLGAMLAHCS